MFSYSTPPEKPEDSSVNVIDMLLPTGAMFSIMQLAEKCSSAIKIGRCSLSDRRELIDWANADCPPRIPLTRTGGVA